MKKIFLIIVLFSIVRTSNCQDITLQEIKEYIRINNHLPNIPTEKEVRENGIDVMEIQGKLLAKIEELTLHMIAQDERIKSLEKISTKK